MAHSQVEFVLGQPALHESGLERLDCPLAVRARCSQAATVSRTQGHLISRPCHHRRLPTSTMRANTCCGNSNAVIFRWPSPPARAPDLLPSPTVPLSSCGPDRRPAQRTRNSAPEPGISRTIASSGRPGSGVAERSTQLRQTSPRRRTLMPLIKRPPILAAVVAVETVRVQARSCRCSGVAACAGELSLRRRRSRSCR